MLKKILADRHSSHVEVFELDEKGAASVLAAGLSDSPIDRVRFLDANDNGLPTAAELATLLAHPKLAELERLVLSGAALKERFMSVVRTPAVSSMQALLLGGCDKIPNKEYDAFAAAPWPRLKSLRIGSSMWDIKEGARDAIWKAPWLPNLEHLAINAFRGAEARLLADSGVLPKLRTFLLNGSKFTEGDVRPLLAQLRSCAGLNISCQLGIESAKALIASECVPKLESCELNLTADARAMLLAAGLDEEAEKQRRSAERRYSFRL